MLALLEQIFLAQTLIDALLPLCRPPWICALAGIDVQPKQKSVTLIGTPPVVAFGFLAFTIAAVSSAFAADWAPRIVLSVDATGSEVSRCRL